MLSVPSRSARTVVGVILGVAFATLAGCGDGGSEEKVERGFAGLTGCLGDTEGVNEVTVFELPGGENDADAPSPAGQLITPEASNGLEYTLGGPTDEDGTITELPLLTFEVFEFENERVAGQRVEQLRNELRTRIRRAGARGTRLPAPRDVRAVGSVGVVYSVASLSPEPPDPALDDLDEEALAGLTSCLERAGYPAGPIVPELAAAGAESA